MNTSGFLSDLEYTTPQKSLAIPLRPGTSAQGLAGIAQSGDGRLEIQQRYPATGNPAPGDTFKLDLRLARIIDGPSQGHVFRVPFMCPDSTVQAVAADGEFSGEVVGSVFISTRWLSGCTGTGRMVFVQGYQPGRVIFKVYQGNDLTEAIIQSPTVNLRIGQETGENSGTFQPGSGLDRFFSSAGGQGLSKSLGSITLLATIATVGYFAMPFLPAINAASQKAASSIQKKIEK